ncbi:hypothetical protein GXW83_27350 [Streptacidiphilus sp. PB12-B1b]|uniref:hypothetical protein n=1 Tax=Streptacidiphilus sp. PB12-B1b TaxID=2705012 RepID=UPI0015F8D3F4|nr:hypothetical protein [Streptacidiphilus sp. PB12-B1b]QMU78863.1 hypothetical protein GXW83_27350 [Streptacidiphilus sp. PB12-B1b]
MTTTLDTSTLLQDSGALLLEIGPADLGENFGSFLGFLAHTPEGQTIVVLPEGQLPEISDSVIRQLLQMPRGRS